MTPALTNADGTMQSILGPVNVYITVNDVSHKMKILVVPTVKHVLILGMDFLKMFKIETKFNNFSFQFIDTSLDAINTIESHSDSSLSQKEELQEIKLYEVI